MARRTSSHLITNLRTFLLGREINGHCRFQYDLAPRTTPTPNIPEGPYYKLNDNYYCERDARSQVKDPTIIFDSGKPKEEKKPDKPKDMFFPCAKITVCRDDPLATPGKCYKY